MTPDEELIEIREQQRMREELLADAWEEWVELQAHWAIRRKDRPDVEPPPRPGACPDQDRPAV